MQMDRGRASGQGEQSVIRVCMRNKSGTDSETKTRGVTEQDGKRGKEGKCSRVALRT